MQCWMHMGVTGMGVRVCHREGGRAVHAALGAHGCDWNGGQGVP